jgi:hypothetical protein
MNGETRVVKSEMPLELVKCGICGKAAVVGAGQRHVCDACREEEQELYRRVRSFIREYPEAGNTVQGIAHALKVDEKKITHLVDSGYFRLVMRTVRPFE